MLAAVEVGFTRTEFTVREYARYGSSYVYMCVSASERLVGDEEIVVGVSTMDGSASEL